jgi:hypothetical protein
VLDRPRVRHLVLIGEGVLDIRRTGQGIGLQYSGHDQATVSHAVARDLVRQLRAAAA